MHMEKQTKNTKLSFTKKSLAIIVLVSAIVGGSVIHTSSHALSWGMTKVKAFNASEDIGFISKWQEVFTKKPEQHIQPVKIVDEQSQVVEVVKKASPAVVSIVASTEVPTFETYYRSPFPDLPPEFEQFFNFRIPELRQNGTEKRRIGAGTGFFVSSDGYIVTNKHVVEDEDAEYTVYLNDEERRGEKVPATVLALDPDSDLAVLKVALEDMPYLEFGDSDSLEVGQTAITIGYALGEFDNTVSKGVISGLSRSITAGSLFSRRSERLSNLIQSDAAINPGNSGGPMLDIEGNVIGVNVAMASAENIGFAIPAREAKDAFEQARDTGTIEKEKRAFLGVRYVLLDELLQEENNLPYDYGALVLRGDTFQDLAVVPGSPADKAGIVENDIILDIEGEKITLRNTLSDIIATHKPDEKVTLRIYHKGDEKEVEVTLGTN